MQIRRDLFTQTLVRLILLDAALASRTGLTVRKFAEGQEVSPLTIHRDLATLRRLGCEIPAGDPLAGKTHVFRYAQGMRPVFTRQVQDFVLSESGKRF